MTDIKVIAEIGQCHEGSLVTAIEMAQAAKEAGAWAVKTQLFDPERLAHPSAVRYWTADNKAEGTRQVDVFQAAGMLSAREMESWCLTCDEIGIVPMCTPFTLDAVDTLTPLVKVWKIASADIVYPELVHAVCQTGYPIIASTGAATESEIRRFVDWVAEWHPSADAVPDYLTLLACSLQYPTPLQDANLARISNLRGTFDCAVGYSDHTEGWYVALPLGAFNPAVVEKHCTLPGRDPETVPDHGMALTMPDELNEYIGHLGAGQAMAGSSALRPHPGELAARQQARRSLWWTANLSAGQTAAWEHVEAMRPGPTGDQVVSWVDMPYELMTLHRDVKAGDPVMWTDFVP